MQPIRVLQVVGKMHYGGMETLMMNIYRNINRNNVQFDFMVHYEEAGEYDEEIRRLGGKIHIMPKVVPRNYFKYKRSLNAFFKSHREYKIIHGHQIAVAFLYHRIAKKYGDKICITHSHSNFSDKNLKGRLADYTSKRSDIYTDIFFGCSVEACSYFFPNAYKENKDMVIIKNGIDVEKYVFNQDLREEIRVKFNIKDKFVVAHIGRFTDAKNHLFLIDIFYNILKYNPDSVLLLIGKGPLESQVMAKVKDLKIEKYVLFLGVISDVFNILQAADVFVLPSLYEGFGIVLIEAQAAGLRCFASKDKIPIDAKCTDLIEYIPLSLSADEWAKIILNNGLTYDRKSTQENIKRAGYDIKSQALSLEKFYIEKSN